MSNSKKYNKFQIAFAFESVLNDYYNEAERALYKAKKVLKIANKIGSRSSYKFDAPSECLQTIRSYIRSGSMNSPSEIDNKITIEELFELLGEIDPELRSQLTSKLESCHFC